MDASSRDKTRFLSALVSRGPGVRIVARSNRSSLGRWNTKAELHQILEVKTQITQDEKEAARLEACEQLLKLLSPSDGGLSQLAGVEVLRKVFDNRCL